MRWRPPSARDLAAALVSGLVAAALAPLVLQALPAGFAAGVAAWGALRLVRSGVAAAARAAVGRKASRDGRA